MTTPKTISLTEPVDNKVPTLGAQLRDFNRRLWRSPSARIGGFLVALMVGIAIFYPIYDQDFNPNRDTNLRARYAKPDCIVGWVQSELNDNPEDNHAFSDMTCDFPMGADKNGRNVMRRVGHGMAVSLRVSVFSVAISLSIGASAGLIAGYLSGILDSVFMRFMDIILAFPSLLLAIALVTMFGPGLRNGMIAVAITQIPAYARLSRSMAISIRNTEYVTAARSVGCGSGRIILTHVLPNSLAPLIVLSTLGLGTAVIETAALGFLGLGQQPPFPELGKMLADSQPGLASGQWWVMLFPGITIVLIVLGFNLLGDALRDVLDPRLKK